MTPDARSQLSARDEMGHELDWRPGPDEWRAREVVHHVADADTLAAARLRRILTGDDPPIPADDEPGLARRLHYRARPIEPARRAIEALRATTAEPLDSLSEAEWARAGRRDSAEGGLERDALHAQDHAARIGRARAAWAARGR